MTVIIRKLIPFSLLLIVVLLINTLLRDLKDALAASYLGAASLPSLKAWIVTPVSLLSVVAYDWLSARSSRQACFHIVIGLFGLYFGIFCFLVFPMRITSYLPWLAPLLNLKFHIVVFFVIGELWATVALALLFWNEATERLTMEEAADLFPLFGMVGQIGTVLAGQLLVLIAHFRQDSRGVPKSGSVDHDDWTAIVFPLGGLLVLGTLFIMLLYFLLPVHKKQLKGPRLQKLHMQIEDTPPRAAASKHWTELMISTASEYQELLAHRQLQLIAGLVFSYGISLNMVECLWRDALQHAFQGDAAGYSTFMGKFWTWVGVMTFVGMLVANGVLRTGGFRVAALVPPGVVLLSGLAFYVLLGVGTPTLVLASGAVQSMLSKATKYSLFDTTKEMAFISVDPLLKRRAKAFIDVAGYRFSKAIGALVIQVTVVLTGSLQQSAVILASVFLAAMGAWLYCAWELGGLLLITKDQHASQSDSNEVPKPAEKQN